MLNQTSKKKKQKNYLEGVKILEADLTYIEQQPEATATDICINWHDTTTTLAWPLCTKEIDLHANFNQTSFQEKIFIYVSKYFTTIPIVVL